jgi:redox-sensitive bicupin YhaK (pirin superfamily)
MNTVTTITTVKTAIKTAGASPEISVPASAKVPRAIVHRTRGHRGGPIVRLVSPSDLGKLIKPFVFLDYFNLDPRNMHGFGIHPHSGIATHTTMLSGSTSYEDTTGKQGVLEAGGVEWMRAGGGVWHDGMPVGTERVRGFQLWVSLPERLENSPPESRYLAPREVQEDGPVRVLLGSYGKAGSIIEPVSPMNYLSVNLKDGQRWRYETPAGHTVGWIAVHQGVIDAGGGVGEGELAVFDATDDAIDFQAKGDTTFVLGSAVKHPHDLVMGSYSVHTSAEALRKGETEIRRIGARLRAEGRLG